MCLTSHGGVVWAVTSPPMTPLGTARTTCERCGHPLEIQILGDRDPDDPDDYTQLHFKMPARHACRLNRPDDVTADRRQGADAP